MEDGTGFSYGLFVEVDIAAKTLGYTGERGTSAHIHNDHKSLLRRSKTDAMNAQVRCRFAPDAIAEMRQQTSN